MDGDQRFSVLSGQTNFKVYGNDVSKFQQSFQERMPTHGDTMQFMINLQKGNSWVQFRITKLLTATDLVEQIQINKTSQIVCRIFANQILNISMNAEGLNENQAVIEVTIETQVIKISFSSDESGVIQINLTYHVQVISFFLQW